MTARDPADTCTKPFGRSCIDALAEGWTAGPVDFCPACTGWYMAVMDAATGRKLAWHRTYTSRAAAKS